MARADRIWVVAFMVLAICSVGEAIATPENGADGEKRRFYPSGVLRAAYPQLASVAIRLDTSLERGGFPDAARCVQGRALGGVLEPGLNGGKAALGYSNACEWRGFAFQIFVLKTRRDPLGVPPGRRYYGLESEIVVRGITFNAGLMRSKEDSVAVIAGFGWRFAPW